MLALRTMTADALKDDVSDACLSRMLITFYMCVGLYDGKQHCVENKDCRNRNLTFFMFVYEMDKLGVFLANHTSMYLA